MTRKEFKFFIEWAATKAKLAIGDEGIYLGNKARDRIDTYIISLIEEADWTFTKEEQAA